MHLARLGLVKPSALGCHTIRDILNFAAPPDVVFLGNRARTAHEKGNYYVSTWRNDDGLMVENVDSVQIEAKIPCQRP